MQSTATESTVKSKTDERGDMFLSVVYLPFDEGDERGLVGKKDRDPHSRPLGLVDYLSLRFNLWVFRAKDTPVSFSVSR